MFRIKMLMVVGGVLLIFAGVQECRVSSGASTTPTKVTCEELASNGPGTNAHLIVRDFMFVPMGAVYDFKGKDETKGWTKVWVPIVPMSVGAQRPDTLAELAFRSGVDVPDDASSTEIVARLQADGVPIPDAMLVESMGVELDADPSVKVIVKTTKVKDAMSFGTYLAQTTKLQGLIVNEIESISGEDRKLLNEALPGVDLSTVWILEDGRAPTGGGGVFLFLVGGAGLLLLAAAWIFGPGIFLRGGAKEARSGRSRRAGSRARDDDGGGSRRRRKRRPKDDSDDGDVDGERLERDLRDFDFSDDPDDDDEPATSRPRRRSSRDGSPRRGSKRAAARGEGDDREERTPSRSRTSKSRAAKARPSAAGKPTAVSDKIACGCDDCGKTFRVAAKHAGKKIKCPGCGAPVRIPG